MPTAHRELGHDTIGPREGAVAPSSDSASVNAPPKAVEQTDRGAVPARRIAILVLGMHRSGTSAVTRVINLLGADLPSNLMPAVAGANEPGFWESMDVYRLNDEILASVGSSWDDWRRFDPAWMRSAEKDRFKVRALAIL